MTKVLVTGASGSVGSYIVKQLQLNTEFKVTALARSDASAALLKKQGFAVLQCEFQSLTSQQLESFDAVVHAAIDKANAEASDRALLSAVDAAAVSRFVYISGIFNLGSTPSSETIDEDYVPNVPELRKWRADIERLVLSLDGGFVVRPGVVWGGRSRTTVAWLKQIHDNGAKDIIGKGGM
jgi:nucleoside-diphosphate-sugar epimerase